MAQLQKPGLTRYYFGRSNIHVELFYGSPIVHVDDWSRPYRPWESYVVLPYWKPHES